MMKKACLFDTFNGTTDGANVAVGRTPQIGPATHISYVFGFWARLYMEG
jgi:hypothetical protein